MMTKELTNWYKKYHTDCCCTEFLTIYNNPKNTDKAFILLVGDVKLRRNSHSQYLWRFSRNHPSRKEIIKRLNATQLWNASISHLKTFEELYDFVWKQLNNPKISQIDQLIIYDIALRLACIKDKKLLPRDYVYLHALPLSAAKVIQNNGLMGGVIIKAQNPIKDLSTHFPSLPAYEIEDLLCYAGKSIRRVGHHKTSILPEEVAIDAIVSKHIKNFKPIIP